MRNSIGVIGFGAFGELLTRLIAPHHSVIVYESRPKSKHLPDNAHFGSLQAAAQCKIVILAVNLADLESVCQNLALYVNKDATVLDVCSVKMKPAAILSEILQGKCKLLATHPLFGPQSMKQGSNGETPAVVWHELTDHSFKEAKELFAEKLGFALIKMDPEEHDKEMAWVHALTFFTGRTLLHMQPPQSKLATGYYKKLMNLVELEAQHSEELFMTIQRGNPYADNIRKQFLQSAQQLEKTILSTK